MIIRHKNNFKHDEIAGEKNFPASQTIPDQSMSMRTILEKHSRGLPVSGSHEGIYDEDVENTLGVNPKTLDLVDIQELTELNRKQIEKVEGRMISFIQSNYMGFGSGVVEPNWGISFQNRG